MINIPKHIQKLKPYKAGKPIDELAREKNISKIVKLASNENPLGPSPKAAEAIKNYIFELHRYTNPSSYKLVNVLSKKYNRAPEEIVCCSGSDAILQYLITAFSGDDDELLTSAGSFIGWYVNVNKYGRKSVEVPLKNYGYDLKAIRKKINTKTKIIYLANPNNPTGTIFTKNEFESFMENISNNILVILDEAYTVYAEDNPDYPNGLDYNFDNLLILRTFSKSYGLAGIRIGFAVGPAYLIKEIYKVKLPFEPNLLAQEAAIAALEDFDFIQKTKEINKKSLDMFKENFDKFGIKYVPGSANFLLLIFPSKEFASNFCNECLNKGLILRHVDTFGIENGVRINSGTIEETEFAIKVINEIYVKLKNN